MSISTGKAIPFYEKGKGLLTVLDQAQIGFTVGRVFFIQYSKQDVERGGHAHRKCQQIIYCLTGRIKILSASGINLDESALLSAGEYAYIPAMHFIWIVFITDDATLAVLCSESFQESDYIRDYSTFKKIIYK